MKNRKMKAALILAAGLIFAGAFLAVLGTVVFGGTPGFYVDTKGIHAADAQKENQQQIMEKTKTEAFTSIAVDMDSADIEVIPSDDYYIEYRLMDNAKPQFEVKDKVLSLKNSKVRSEYRFSFVNFNFSFSEADVEMDVVKIYVPEAAEFENVKLHTGVGDIKIEGNLNAETLSITEDYGSFTADTLNGKKAELTLTGDAYINNLTMDSMKLEDEYGSLRVDKYNCKKADIMLSSGDLTFSKADFNDLAIENEYGSVSIELEKKLSQYRMELKTDYGEIILPDGSRMEQSENRVSNTEENIYPVDENPVGEFQVLCESGDITLSD
jgi:DUF4097 and DUF4098 domain-containing protein YvlB